MSNPPSVVGYGNLPQKPPENAAESKMNVVPTDSNYATVPSMAANSQAVANSAASAASAINSLHVVQQKWVSVAKESGVEVGEDKLATQDLAKFASTNHRKN